MRRTPRLIWPVLDHVKPLTDGGQDDNDNLVTGSALINSAKANYTIEQLRWTLRSLPSESNWDGMTSWYLDLVERKPDLPKSSLLLENWHYATIAAR